MLKLFWAEERARASAKRRRPPVYEFPQQKPADHKQWVEKVKQLPDVRQDKVMAIREALEADRYDVDSRLNELFDRLPDELGNLTSADK